MDGRLVLQTRYWAEPEYDTGHFPAGRFAAIARAIPCRFLSMDIARRRDGRWTLIEIGDGQVTGLPDHVDLRGFFTRLRI